MGLRTDLKTTCVALQRFRKIDKTVTLNAMIILLLVAESDKAGIGVALLRYESGMKEDAVSRVLDILGSKGRLTKAGLGLLELSTLGVPDNRFKTATITVKGKEVIRSLFDEKAEVQ